MKARKLVNYSGLFISIFCLSCMYVFPEVTKNAVISSLQLCVKSVIPSLFPFIVCTRIVIFLYTAKNANSESQPILPVILLSKNALIAFVLGLISGFPTGASISGQMYISGLISKEEAEKIAVFSSVAGPSFCIVFFGDNIMHNRLCGLAVYIACALSSFGLLILHNLLFCNRNFDKENFKSNDFTVKYAGKNLSSLTQIITDSCLTVINICAYVTFFTCIGEVLTRTSSFFISGLYSKKAYICGFLEMTGGISALSKFNFSKRLLTGAFIIGFSGVSAILQVLDICDRYSLNCRKIFFVKLASAFTVPVLTFLIIAFSNFVNITTVLILIFAIMVITGFFIVLKLIAQKYKKNKN